MGLKCLKVKKISLCGSGALSEGFSIVHAAGIKSADSFPLLSHYFKYNLKNYKMAGNMTSSTIWCVCFVAILLSLIEVSQANYKNAPMNGIMFGKRGPSDYDARSKAFTAMCEIATEACQAWFPSQENK
ncbi:unnamed protein product [Parnassius apollo]|uniref:(apollo) hypothetical protein n=1 Tax=Parnassius apollo TaxID=110799 RepID=A0A8S3Y3F0_PARAO|nr:unnamed protein product [Parnassius apollo]